MIYALMVLTALGMVFANYQYKTKGVVWGRPLAGVLGIITLTLTIAKIVMVLSLPTELRGLMIKTDQQYLNSVSEFLGDYIATNFPGSKILLITGPITERNRRQHKKNVILLEKGLAGKAEILDTESLLIPSAGGAGKDQHAFPEDFGFTALAFDLMTERHPKSNLVVSFLDLPEDYHEMKFWSIAPERRPKLVIVLGNPYELRNAIELGYVSAVITTNPKYAPGSQQKTAKNYRELFHQRFLLINKENIQVIANENPGLFMKESEFSLGQSPFVR